MQYAPTLMAKSYQFEYAPSRRWKCGSSQNWKDSSRATSSLKVTPRPGAVGSGKLSPSMVGITGKRSRGKPADCQCQYSSWARLLIDAQKCIVAAVVTGPSGLCGIMSM